jgi:hypothetical protein
MRSRIDRAAFQLALSIAKCYGLLSITAYAHGRACKVFDMPLHIEESC